MHLLVCVLLGSAASPSQAAEQRSANVWWNGVEEFAKAQITNSMSAAVRRPGTAGKVAMPAVFLHPQNDDRSIAKYPKVSMGLGEGIRVFLLTYVGISDGFAWGEEAHPADGARFYIDINGTDVLAAEVKESKWVPVAAQLFEAPAGGGPFEADVSLQTDCGGKANSNYDWAMFGEPLIVNTDGRTLRQATPVSGAGGVVIADVEGGTGEIVVEGLDAAGQPIAEASATQAVDPPGLTFVSFDFGATKGCEQWQWRAEGLRVADAWGGSWEPLLRLTSCGPANAVTIAGDRLIMRAGVTNTGKGALLPEHHATVTCNGVEKPIERLAPGESAAVEFDLGIPDVGTLHLEATAFCAGTGTSIISGVPVWPELPKLPLIRPKKAEARKLNDDFMLLQNPEVRWLLYTGGDAQGALVYAWAGDRWELSGSVNPWLYYTQTNTPGGGTPGLSGWEVEAARGGVEVRAESPGERFACSLRLALADDGPALQADLQVTTTQEETLAAMWGPAVHAGDRGTGAAKGIAIFPGLEYLEGDERSSSTRDLAPPLNQRWTPHRFKITAPLMMVETRDGGPVVAVAWDPNQKWDGEHTQPATRFASPDFLNQQDNHLMQLGLPSVPEFIPESADRTAEPLTLEAGKSWTLSQRIIVTVPRPDATGILEASAGVVDYPEAEAAPRSFEDEMALCRHGFLKSVWDEQTQTSLHYVGSGKSNAPGFATLMLMDGRAVAQGEDRAAVLDRVKLIGEKTLREQGAPGLTSTAACHIMGWEFPYHWGHLPGALAGMRDSAHGSVDGQEADGGWGYYPDESRKTLGEPGTRVMGIAGRNAYVLAKWVAISGDPDAEEALQAALKHMERFRVPRGAQGWECPIMEPDVLASAYAVRAYVWTYMATGDPKWLEKARLWARTGLPFQYTWDDGAHPGMRYASIPVLGSTFFTHSWLGLPVQWCGLVYAYGLQELMRFDNDDLWRRQVEGMTVSAMHQQWPWEGPPELVGTYPDSYGQWFTHRNGVYINPEDIEVNLLALHGLDPGLRSVPVETKEGLIHVTAPCDVAAKGTDKTLELDLKYVPQQVIYVTVAPVAIGEDAKLVAGGAALGKQDDLAPSETGWALNSATNVLVLGVQTDAEGKAHASLTGLARKLPEKPPVTSTWDFDRDVEGWQPGHSCNVTAADGNLKITVTGDDPYAISGPAEISAARSGLVKARVRLSAGSQVGLFWRASGSPGWGPDKEVHADCPGDGEWHEITFDLSGHALWRGKITQIRFDIEPADTPAGSTLEVDWIRPA
ncbi:MAG: hypothetical protein FJX75_13390 [Armatimonadetes bacterium]|nr:hypothetical protein [Armatimonadota bacterium]